MGIQLQHLQLLALGNDGAAKPHVRVSQNGKAEILQGLRLIGSTLCEEDAVRKGMAEISWQGCPLAIGKGLRNLHSC